jgi:hypothetical protein
VARSLRAASQVRPKDSAYREVIAWYEDQLANAAPPTGLAWEPVKIGPTWQYDNGWALPAFTLGWRNLAWAGLNLTSPKGGSWVYTLEQARFLLWHDAIDPETGSFLYPTQVLQRLKGWGKDPFAVTDSTTHICSEDAMFDRWDGDVPLGRQIPQPYVQIVGVSQDQIKRNTMPLFPALVPPETRRKYGLQVGKLDVWARGDVAHIEAVTSSVMSLEGPRPTLIIRNETQNWNESNGGHALAGAIEGNMAKADEDLAPSRQLDICNAYRPGEDSVGQRAREAYEKTVGSRCDAHSGDDGWSEDCIDCQPPTAADFGMLYDSLEAPPEAPLTVEAAPGVVEAIRGDSVWLNVKRILNSIKNPANPPSESRRKWYNQITAAEDAWADPKDVAAGARDDGLQDGDTVVLFGDGSKSDDGTGIVACRVSDGLCQVLHFQLPKKGQIVDRDAVDVAVVKAFNQFRVVAFWFDPSHAKDDESTEGDNRFWWPLVDEWSRRHGRRLKCHPVKTGNRAHAVAFDMALDLNQKVFVEGCGQTLGELEEQSQKPPADRAVIFKRSAVLSEHMRNAKRAPGKWGVSIRKEHRESARKIDLAICLVGARMLRRIYQLSIKQGTPGQGRVIVFDK